METVELRVHGVHGTSPAAMLGVADDEVGQVAGDALTGLYRVRAGDPPYRRLAGSGVSVEAYSWGALTSGIRGVLGWVRRTLWLVLLPFALVNLAYWARVEAGRDDVRARLGARAVRAAGLLLTIFFVLTPCVLAIDLATWQCYRYDVPSCARIPSALDFLAGWSPGQRIAAASLLPLAVVGVLWWLSRTSLARYECVDDPAAPRGPLVPAQPGVPVLRHPYLWNGTERTQRLQRAHVAAGVATIVLFVTVHLQHAARPGAHLVALVWVPLVAAAVVLVLALVVVLVPHDHDVEPLPATGLGRALGVAVRRAGPRLEQGLALASLATYAVMVVVLVLTCSGPGQVDQGIGYTARNIWFIALFVAVTVLHLTVFTGGRMSLWVAFPLMALALAGFVALGVMHVAGAYDEDHPGTVTSVAVLTFLAWLALSAWHYLHGRDDAVVQARAWRGAGASVLLAAAAWTALLFSSAAVVAVADYLNGADHGVGDLVTVTKVETDEYHGSARSSDPVAYRASGTVVLRRARVVVSGDPASVTVTAGTVEMRGLTRRVSDPQPRKPVKSRGRTVVTGGPVTLEVPSTGVRMADSCLDDVPEAGRCTAEDIGFRGDSRLSVPEGADGTVALTVAPGVALDPSAAPQTPLAVPQVLVWTPVAQLVWVVLAGLVVVGCLLVFWRRVAGRLALHPGTADDGLDVRDHAGCLAGRRRAALAHRAEALLDLVGLVTAPVALELIVLSMTGVPPWALPRAGWTRGLADVAMYLVVGLSAALVMLGSRIRRSESTRKAVGVIWDLTTFWPRAAHPLAPPCYAERVVPELLTRTRWALDAPSGTGTRNQVILSGHSQGSLIVLAAASRLGPDHLSRLRMITYGSQVRALYGRVFPAVLGPDAIGYAATTGPTTLRDPFPDMPRTSPPVAGPPDPAPTGSFLDRLRTAGGEWVNLFRRTDPLGYRVFSDLDGDLDVPVPEVPAGASGDPGPQVMGHSGYQHTLVYRERVRAWSGEPLVRDPRGTGELPPLPPT